MRTRCRTHNPARIGLTPRAQAHPTLAHPNLQPHTGNVPDYSVTLHTVRTIHSSPDHQRHPAHGLRSTGPVAGQLAVCRSVSSFHPHAHRHFVVGLEIKREVLVGELARPRQAALPISAALGGMRVPALLYYLLNPDGIAARGWGMPMATDFEAQPELLLMAKTGILCASLCADALGYIRLLWVTRNHSVQMDV